MSRAVPTVSGLTGAPTPVATPPKKTSGLLLRPAPKEVDPSPTAQMAPQKAVVIATPPEVPELDPRYERVTPPVNLASPVSTTASEANLGSGHVLLQLAQVVRSPYQRRTSIDMEHVEVLAQSIKEVGLNTPITVRRVGDKYELIAGENRLEAHRLLGLTEIPTVIKSAEHASDADAAIALAIDNILHKGLTDYEIYKHVKMLEDEKFVTSITDTARLFGTSRTNVQRWQSFGKLPIAALALIEKRPATVGAALAYTLKEFAESSPALVTEAIQLVVEGKLTQKRVAAWMQHRSGNKTAGRRSAEPITATQGAKLGEIISSETELTVRGDKIDMNKLRELILEHADELERKDATTE